MTLKLDKILQYSYSRDKKKKRKILFIFIIIQEFITHFVIYKEHKYSKYFNDVVYCPSQKYLQIFYIIYGISFSYINI